MNKKVLIKCSNCGLTDFERTTIGEILSTEGRFYVNAYACLNCGHIELFEPALDAYAKQLREEYEAKKREEELERAKAEEARQQRIKELNEIIDNLDSTVRQVNEAKKELDKLGGNSINKPPYYL